MTDEIKTNNDSAALREIAKTLLQTSERLRVEAEELNKRAQQIDEAIKQKKLK